VTAAVLLLTGVGVAAQASPPPVTFVDEAVEAGIVLRNVSGSAEKRHILETTGAGACFLDHDLDGDLDVYLVNGATVETLFGDNPARDALYRNDGAGRFVDITLEAGLGDRGWGGGCTVGDYDNDGDPDLYVTNFGPNVLYRNEGGGRFSDVTATAGVAGASWSLGAAFFDMEGDGDLDLYVSNYLRFKTGSAGSQPGGCTWKGIPVMCGPRGFAGEEDVLYRNDGGGRFTDVTAASGIAGPALYGMGVVTGDVEGDGDPDLFVANDSQDNHLWINDGQGRFQDRGLWAGVALSGDGRQQASMGADLGDYDGDGDEDLFVTNFSDDYHTLYRNDGGGLFTDATVEAGLAAATRSSLGWATAFFDYDNDGDLDLFVASGHVYPQVDGRDATTTYRQQNLLFRNDGDGRFTDVSNDSGPGLLQVRASRGTAVGDYDDDGDMDLLVVNENDVPTLLRNDGGNARGWLKVRLVGTRSNRDAIGARVQVWIGERSLLREVRLTAGYCSSHDPRVHFGLGAATKADRVEVRWSSGHNEVLRDVPAGRLITVKEDEGIIANTTLGGAAIRRRFGPLPESPAATAAHARRRLARPAGDASSPRALSAIETVAQAGSRRIMAGDYDAGITALEQAIAQMPPVGNATTPVTVDTDRVRTLLASLYANLGVGLMRAERLDECAAPLEQAIALNPHRNTYRQNLGLCHYHARRHADAVSAFQQARTIDARSETLSYDLGRAQAAAGRCAEALPELERARRELPAGADSEGRRAESWYHTGGCLADLGRADQAADAFREALSLVPGHQRALYKLGLAWRAAGRLGAAEAAQRLFQARQSADEVVRGLERAGPRTPSERIRVARTFLEAGLPTEASIEVQKALASAPGNAPAHVMQGDVHLALRPRDLSTAERAFQRALQLHPDLPDALAGLAEVRRHQARTEEAERIATQLLAQYPNHRDSALVLARLHIAADRPAEAIRLLEDVLRKSQDHRLAMILMADAYLGPSNPAASPDEALRRLDKAGALYGEDVPVRLRALAEAGRTEEATKLLAETPFMGSHQREQLAAVLRERKRLN